MESTSQIIYAGKEAQEVLEVAFETKVKGDVLLLDGIVSRKKQFIPAVINAIQQMK